MHSRSMAFKGVVATGLVILLASCGGDDTAASGGLLPEKGESTVNSTSIDLVISDDRLEPIIKLEPIVAISELPSHVNALFKVVDDDLNPVTGLAEKHTDLWKDHFSISYEDDSPMDVESYTTIQPATNLQLPTTIAIDISSSVSNDDFIASVTGVRDALIDTSGAEPTSRLLDKQAVSIIVFDSTVTHYPATGITRDPVQIKAIFDELLESDYRNLRDSNNSTALYKAAKEGLSTTLNLFSPTDTPLGTLIVISDGSANSNLVTLDEVITDRDSTKQRVFTLSSQTERLEWFDIASAPENEIEVANLSEVSEVVSDIISGLSTSLDGYYVLKHSTASQSGSQKLILEYEDSIGNLYQMDYEYDTGSFTGSVILLSMDVEKQTLKEAGFVPFALTATAYPYFNVLEPDLQLDWYLDGIEIDSSVNKVDIDINAHGIHKLQAVSDRETDTTLDDVQATSWFSVAPYEISSINYFGLWDLKLETAEQSISHVWSAKPYLADGQQKLDDDDQPITCDFDPSTQAFTLCECSFTGSERNVLMFMSDDIQSCVVEAVDSTNGDLLGATYAEVKPFVMEYTLTAYYIRSSLDQAISFEVGSSDPHQLSEQWQVVSAEGSWHEKMGSYVLKSQSIGHGQQSTIEFMASFSTIGFDFLTRSEEGYDFLELYIDGERVFWYSGIMSEWRSTDQIVVPFGLHSVEIKYKKDATKSHSSDAVYIDNIVYL